MKIEADEEKQDNSQAVFLDTKNNVLIPRERETNTEEKKDAPQKRKNLFWLPIGIALGAAVGVSKGNLPFWLSIGIVFGVLVDTLAKKDAKK